LKKKGPKGGVIHTSGTQGKEKSWMGRAWPPESFPVGVGPVQISESFMDLKQQRRIMRDPKIDWKA